MPSWLSGHSWRVQAGSPKVSIRTSRAWKVKWRCIDFYQIRYKDCRVAVSSLHPLRSSCMLAGQAARADRRRWDKCRVGALHPGGFRRLAIMAWLADLGFRIFLMHCVLAGQAARADRTLWGECLAGALYLEDFRRLAAAAGFEDPRVLQAAPIAVRDGALAAAVGSARFASITFRLFKLEPGALEDAPEDYGQVNTDGRLLQVVTLGTALMQ